MLGTQVRRIWHYKIFGHNQITLHKAFWFSTMSGIGIVVVGGMTYALTEWCGLHYMVSVVIASGVAYILKFLVSALWIFGR